MPVIQHAVENAMDTCPNRCSIFSMWKFLGALLLVATPALAQENATAYEALRVVGSELGRGALNHVVSINGVKGDPQPKKWTIILEYPDGRGLREVEDVENDYDTDEEHGPFSSVKRRIKDTFRRTQEEARGMFDRVKRSFSDFINRG